MLIAAGIFLIAQIALFAVLQSIWFKSKVLRFAERLVEQQYGLRLELDSLDYTFGKDLNATLTRVRLSGKEQSMPFFTAQRIFLQIPYSTLWRSSTRITQLIVSNPFFNLDYLPRSGFGRSGSGSPSDLHIDHAEITEGKVSALQKIVTNVNLDVSLESNRLLIRKINGGYDSAVIEGHGTISLGDTVSYDLSFKTSGDVSLLRNFSEEIPKLSGVFQGEGKFLGTGADWRASLRFHVPKLQIESSGAFPLDGDLEYLFGKTTPLTLNLMWRDLPMEAVHRVYPDVPVLNSGSTGEFHYRGNDSFWDAEGSLQMVLQPQQGPIPVSGVVKAELGDGHITLQGASLTMHSVSSTISGQLRRNELDLNVAGKADALSDLGVFVSDLRRLPLSASFEGNLRGAYSSITIDGRIDADSPDSSIHLQGNYQLAHDQFDIGFSGKSGSDLASKLSGLKAHGAFDFQGNASGTLARPAIQARIVGRQLSVEDVAIGAAEVVVEGSTKQLRAAVTLADLQTQLNGTYFWANRNFSVEGAFDSFRIETVRPLLPVDLRDLNGVLSGKFTLKGNARSLLSSEGHLQFGESTLTYSGTQFEIAEGSTLDWAKERLWPQVQLRSNDGSLTIAGSMPIRKSGTLDLLISGNVSLTAANRFIPDWNLSGTSEIKAEVRGSLNKPVFTGVASIHNAAAFDSQHRVSVRDVEGQLELQETSINVNVHGNVNGAQSTISAAIPVEKGAGKIQVSMRQLDISTFLPQGAAAGSIDLDVTAEGFGVKPRDWNGTATANLSDITLQENTIHFDKPVRLDLSAGVLTLAPFEMNAAGLLHLEGGGSIRLSTNELNAELKGSGDLSLLSDFVPQLQANGPVEISLTASGTTAAPVFTGMLRTEGALLRSTDYPILLEEIRLVAPFDVKGIHVTSFSARSGGGTVEGHGGMSWRNGKPRALNFEITGRNVGLNYPEGLRSQLDGQAQIRGPVDSLILSGDVGILRSQFRDNIDYRDRLINTLLSQKQTIELPSTSTARLQLDINVKTIEDFEMNNNIAKLHASAALHLAGTMDSPRLTGDVRLRRGSRLFLENNEFYVEHGMLTFYGTRQLNPVVDAVLTTSVIDEDEFQEYRITIPLQGQLDQLADAEPTSEPSLQKGQIFSLLLTHRKTELTVAASLIFQQQLASYLTGKLFFNFQERLAGALGFSRFTIAPEDLISSEQNPGARVILGKELLPGLAVQYSALLSQHSESTWLANYRLRNRLNILFVDQEDGSYTGGLRHKLLFGGARSEKTPRGAFMEPQISRIETKVDPPLIENSVLQALGLKSGESYDGWKTVDRATQFKQSLQKQQYLFPLIEISETYHDQNVDLLVIASTRGRRRMDFSGIQVVSADQATYQKWWREGLSESTVLLQIHDDILLKLYKQGYHQAKVKSSINETPDGIDYRFEALAGIRYATSEIRFEGNTRYTDQALRRDLALLYDSPEEMLLEALHRFHSFKEKVEALYISKGFLDVKVESGPAAYSQGPSGSVVQTVQILEGDSWNIVAIEVTGVPSLPKDLQEQLLLVSGSIYDSQNLKEDQITITDYYQHLGYRNAELETSIKKESGSGLILQYQLKTGIIAHVGNINITGAGRTRLSVIRGRIQMKTGDILTSDELIRTQNALTSLQLFKRVRVEPKEVSPGLYDIEIQVVEADPYIFTYGLRYDSERHTEGELQMEDLNLLGFGQNVLLYGRWNSLESIYRLVFHSIPEATRAETLNLVPWRTLLTLSYEKNEQPSFLSTLRTIDFQRRWELGGPFVLLTNYKYEQGRVTSSIGGPISFDIRQNVSRILGIIIVDERDDPFDSHRGYFFSNEVEHAPKFLKSDLVFTKNYSQYFQYFSIGRIVSASAIRLGIAGDLIGSEQFLAGGSSTLRGFQLNEVGPHSTITGLPIGGEAVLILNEEIRFPIYSWLRGVVFYDGGNVYPTLADLSLSDLRHTAGFGLRLTSPYGILRFDAGFNMAPRDPEPSYVLHFGLGQAW